MISFNFTASLTSNQVLSYTSGGVLSSNFSNCVDKNQIWKLPLFPGTHTFKDLLEGKHVTGYMRWLRKLSVTLFRIHVFCLVAYPLFPIRWSPPTLCFLLCFITNVSMFVVKTLIHFWLQFIFTGHLFHGLEIGRGPWRRKETDRRSKKTRGGRAWETKGETGKRTNEKGRRKKERSKENFRRQDKTWSTWPI